MNLQNLLIAVMMATMLAGCSGGKSFAPLETATDVDLARYSGKWYEIARYPHSFEDGCSNVTADYTVQANGTLLVVNRCTLREKGGKVKEAVGRAKVIDPSTNARLKVSFFWPFYGDYWIIRLDPEYRHAIVGTPSRKYLWILSRTPEIEPAILTQLIAETGRLGFDPGRLIMTDHTDIPN